MQKQTPKFLKQGKQNTANPKLENLLNPVNNKPKPDQNPENFLETALDSSSQVNSKLDKLFVEALPLGLHKIRSFNNLTK